MIRYLLKISGTIRYVFLVLLAGGIGSCAKYGAPEADYRFFGTITDTDGNTIEKVSVIIKEEGYRRDSLMTDGNGNYSSAGFVSNWETSSWKISVKDAGLSPDGCFYPAEISFIVTEDDFTDRNPKDKYDMGTLTRNINFVLQKKEE